MATLKMDIEAARTVELDINTSRDQIETSLNSMNAKVENLQPNWMGNSATQFFDRYTEMRTQLINYLESLGNLGTSLGQEISQWEEMARTLG